MGLIFLVLRKSLGFLILGLGITSLVFIINCDPIVEYFLPQNFSSQLHYVRRAINECIPLIAAVVVGIFAQGVVMMYRLYERAIQEHLKELNKVAEAFFNKINEIGNPTYFSASVRGLGGYRLYMHIEAPLCDRYREIVRDYEDLVKDIGNHWKKAGDVLNKVNRLCEKITKHNERVKELERKLEKCLSDLIGNKIVPNLSGVDPNLLKNFMRDVLLGEVVPNIVEKCKKFKEVDYNDIDRIYKRRSRSLEFRNGSLWVDGYNVGNITENDWKKYENLIIEVIYEVLKEYDKQLDELVEEGWKLKKESEVVNEELRESLKIVKDAKILPITTCKYLR